MVVLKYNEKKPSIFLLLCPSGLFLMRSLCKCLVMHLPPRTTCCAYPSSPLYPTQFLITPLKAANSWIQWVQHNKLIVMRSTVANNFSTWRLQLSEIAFSCVTIELSQYLPAPVILLLQIHLSLPCFVTLQMGHISIFLCQADTVSGFSIEGTRGSLQEKGASIPNSSLAASPSHVTVTSSF